MAIRWVVWVFATFSVGLAHHTKPPPDDPPGVLQTGSGNLETSLRHPRIQLQLSVQPKAKARPWWSGPRPEPQSFETQTQLEPGWRVYQTGWASWYGPRFHGRLTASGQRYNQYGISAAHLRLPFGTRVRVTNLRTGQSIVLRINDRGPYSRYIIDLSWGAKQAIGMVDIAPVRLEVVR